MVTAVGGVQVHKDVRVPSEQQVRGAPRLGRFHLHVVAVEVQPLTIGPSAHERGPVLSRPVGVTGRECLVPVHVIDGHDQEDEAVEQRRERAEGEIAQQHLRGFLALHFAGVDVGLEIDHRLPGGRRFRGPTHHRPGRDGVRHRPPLRADGEGVERDRRAEAAERVQKADHVGVAGGLAILRGFGPRALRAEGSGRQERQGDRQAGPMPRRREATDRRSHPPPGPPPARSRAGSGPCRALHRYPLERRACPRRPLARRAGFRSTTVAAARGSLREALLAADDDLLARLDTGTCLDEAGRAHAELNLAAGRLSVVHHPDEVGALERQHRVFGDDHGIGPDSGGEANLDEHAGLQLAARDSAPAP